MHIFILFTTSNLLCYISEQRRHTVCGRTMPQPLFRQNFISSMMIEDVKKQRSSFHDATLTPQELHKAYFP